MTDPDQPDSSVVDVGKPPRKPPSGELPPVEPPTMGFILQLFVIPLVIVSIIVLIWLLFNWLAHMGSNPSDLVADLKKRNDSSWQKALTLADLLRNPRYEHLLRDQKLAQQLAEVLTDEIADADMDDNALQLRVYLCLVLGNFQIPEALPPLLQAATTERQTAEVDVRLSALQALAVFAYNNRAEDLAKNAELMKTLLDASREQATGVDERHSRAELRSRAAFALGMLDGPAALGRLEVMLADAYPNARYNAATGLCRHGDLRALPVLSEMLDPNNSEAVASEENEASKPSKRSAVMKNGLEAAGLLVARNKSADLQPLMEALDKITSSDLAQFEPGVRRGIRIKTEEVRSSLKDRNKSFAP